MRRDVKINLVEKKLVWRIWQEKSGCFKALSAGLAQAAEEVVFAESSGEKVVTQAPWNHGLRGE